MTGNDESEHEYEFEHERESDGRPAKARRGADPSAVLPKYLYQGLQKQDVETLQVASEFIDRLLDERARPVDQTELPDAADPISQTSEGYIVEEYVKCGKDNCKCTSGAEAEMHGPYKYRYYRDDTGTLQKEYADNE